MTWANYDDVLSQLQSASLVLPGGGLEIDTIKPVRCFVDGRDREKRGWYWLNEKEIRGQRYITGAFGVYEGNDNGKQTVKINLDGKALQLSIDERAAIRARHDENMRRLKALRAREAREAAVRAERAWRAYLPTGSSQYLERKGVGAHGLRFSPSGNGTVAVPMLRENQVVGLQIIRGKDRGSKLEKEYFPKGIDKIGAHHLLGRVVDRGLCLVAEGYATAATLFEALGKTIPVAVAFDAGSLMPVAQALHRQHPRLKLLIAADDDRIQKCRACGKPTAVDKGPACLHCGAEHDQKNPGIEAAGNAAHAVGGSVLAPSFSIERRDDQKGPNDWNDLYQAEGLHVVRAQVEAHLAGLGWLQQSERAATASRGAGGSAVGEGEGNGRDELANRVSIDEACERYSLVYGGKGTLFDHQEHALVPKADVLDLLPDHGWRDWKQRWERKVVRLTEVGFDPAETDPTIRCNLWAGWPTEPRDGACGKLLAILEHLCSGEKNSREIYHWVLKWLAYPIQNPGAKMRTALVFHGPQGVGKNLFFESVMAIYGQYGRIVDQAAVEDKFNDWMSGKLFLIADEVVARNELFHLKNKLKGIVTGDWIRINPKNVAAHDERNHVNLVFLSNESKPLALEKDDRRHVVIWTPEKMDREVYNEVKAELAGGGVAALHHYLLHLELGEFNEFAAAPITASKEDLIDINLDSVERFVRDWCSGDIDFKEGILPLAPCSSADLYKAYTRWCDIEGVQRPREQSDFLGRLIKIPGWSKGHKDRYNNAANGGQTVRCRMMLPSEAALTAAAAAGQDDHRRLPHETQAQWLTRCFFSFRAAMGLL